MSMKSVMMSTVGATTGLILGNYLYEADKKANQYMEVPVPFYTVRKAAKDTAAAVENKYNEIKEKFKKDDQDQEAVHQMTDEEVMEELQQPNIHEVTDEEVTEMLQKDQEAAVETTAHEIIDAEVVGDKVVPVNQEAEQVETTEQIEQVNPTNNEQVVGSTEETSIPHFTVVDQQPVQPQQEVQNTEEQVKPESQQQEEKKPDEKKASTNNKATTKGSRAKSAK